MVLFVFLVETVSVFYQEILKIEVDNMQFCKVNSRLEIQLKFKKDRWLWTSMQLMMGKD